MHPFSAIIIKTKWKHELLFRVCLFSKAKSQAPSCPVITPEQLYMCMCASQKGREKNEHNLLGWRELWVFLN